MSEKKSEKSVKTELKEAVQERISLSREMSDEEIRELIDQVIIQKGRGYGLNYEQKKELSKESFYAIRKLDILEELTSDPGVTEIMINGTDNIFIERNGRLMQWDKTFESPGKLEDVIQQIVAKCNRTVNEASPIADARLENG